MTKKEMVYEILSNTTFTGVNEKDIDKLIRVNTKKRVQEVYSYFKENPSNIPTKTLAAFCMDCLGY